MTERFKDAQGLLAVAIRRPVSVISIVLLIFFFGVLAVFELPVQLTPDIAQPTITVTTNWPGAAPVDVESDVVEPQEEVLKRVSGLTNMESSSSLGRGEITLEFQVGSDMDQALVRVSNQLGQVRSYPENVDRPVISTSNSAGPPLAVIIIRSRYPTVSPQSYRTWVDDVIVPEIERIPGVASIRVRGGRANEVHVNVDVGALAARGITMSQVASRVTGELRDISAGDFDLGKRRLVVRSMLKPEQVRDLERVVIASNEDGVPVRLGDVATVEISVGKARDFAIADNDVAIALLPSREAGFNVLEVTEEIRRVVEELDETRFAPEGLKIEVVDDQVGYIRGAIDVVQSNLMVGGVLAIFVLLIFLRRFGAAFIISLAIPICVFGTAIGMAMLGRSVNVVSLAGMTFAIGMVIDNSIVALENIDTWSKRVGDARLAAWHGIREVAGALVASTATTAAVFVPIIVWQGEVGEILRDLAYAISISVGISLIVSVAVIPSLAAIILRSGSTREPPLRRLAAVGEKARTMIASVSSWLAARTWRAVTMVVLAVTTTSIVALLLLPKMEYLPTGNRNLIFGIILPPAGYSVEESIKIGHGNQAVMVGHTGKSVDGIPAVRRSFFVGDPSLFISGAAAENPDEVKRLRDFMQALHGRIPGVINFASQSSLFSRGIGAGRAIDLELSGPDLNALISVGRSLMGPIQEAVPKSRVRPLPVLDEGAPELHVIPRREEAAELGVSSAELAFVADTYIDGRKVGEWSREGEPKVDVLIKSQVREGADSRRLLEDAPVATSQGDIVPFSVLADLETKLGPTVVRRVERRRAVTLQVTPPDDMPFEAAIEALEAKVVAPLIASGDLPSNVRIDIGGSAGKLKDAQTQFGWVLLIALLISFFLMAALFEDFLAPIVVLVTIPLAAGGGVIGLRLVDEFIGEQPLDVMSAVGFLILIGVVVNNAILIVDRAIGRLREGASIDEAVHGAVADRVRPIFMSTLTSLAGLAPMAIATGSGSELYRGVGAILLGGLFLSTILTLFVVPPLFSLLWRLRLVFVQPEAEPAE